MQNIKNILLDSVKFQAAIESKLPAGAPVLSTKVTEMFTGMPDVPDLPFDIPAPEVPVLPDLPELPDLPGGNGGTDLSRARTTTARATASNLKTSKSMLYFE